MLTTVARICQNSTGLVELVQDSGGVRFRLTLWTHTQQFVFAYETVGAMLLNQSIRGKPFKVQRLLRFRFDALTGNPMVKIRAQKTHPGSREFNERNASFLNETSYEPFGAAHFVCRSSDV
jgi:hypothetical protein